MKINSLSLGSFKKLLNSMNPESIVICTNALYILPTFGSYTGFYQEIYFDFTDNPDKGVKVKDLLEGIEKALSTFPITENTKIWLGDNESSSGMCPVFVEQFNEEYVTITIVQK